MPEVKIKQGVWNGLKSAAARHGKPPEALANRALKEFLQRLEDEELIAKSRRAARRLPLREQDAEQAVRSYRERK